MAAPESDIEIARKATALPITEIGKKLDIAPESLIPYGQIKAKLHLGSLEQKLQQQQDGKLILVTAVSPTPMGEGKTTTTVGLGDALNRIGKKASVCIREPSLGPCFGMKGGAAGGGYAQVIPMEDINLHFTGDSHAISAAHNLLAAMVDNYIHWDNELQLDSRRIRWKRVVDMNDRALRDINIGLGGVNNGIPRESGYDITVASEVMAILCLAENLEDLHDRLSRIIVGYSRNCRAVTAGEINAAGAMTALLKDAFMPNLVQTLENNPAFIHGGPFANIAHGCSSVIATKTALKLSDYVITEAGFGADLGAEKFFDIKCRKANLKPDASVLVVTTRALKFHGGQAKTDFEKEDLEALRSGCENLGRHIRNLGQFGVPLVVAINRFSSDTQAELDLIRDYCAQFCVEAYDCNHWADGGAGTEALAQHLVKMTDSVQSQFRTLYDDKMPLLDKVRHIARTLYGADDIMVDKKVREEFQIFQESGYGEFPVCIAKTPYSFSTDPRLLGAPSDFQLPIREIRLSAGAEFLVVICGAVMTMPGLPRKPAAESICVNDKGQIEGLF
ncbi:MAG: formate--tetrahydrofolate ligase [Gammaproteobacteria bacterium]|nr:formate--tetrahydrofolate ligase [Gammaproteobacteria bacterium]